jgi:two-component system response regulator PilR (NtrC family)
VSKQILGNSPAVRELIRMIEKVSNTKANILITGESGTGKELVARMIHESSFIKNHPFVSVNCGAISESLIESEMFGHHKGSFTGAVTEKAGLFEVAHRGTLFLDEVGELPLSMQVKLLRAIQEKTIRKVGGVEDLRVDVRIIAATNRDLELAVKKGIFREDLYYRLNVILIRTPPLRVRHGDISLLSQYFLKIFSERLGKPIKGFEDLAQKALEAYSWPGNVRELENSIERAVTLETEPLIRLSSLPKIIHTEVKQAEQSEIRLPAPDFSKGCLNIDQILDQVERTYVLAALKASAGAKRKAAELLGISFRSIRYRLSKLGLMQDDNE